MKENEHEIGTSPADGCRHTRGRKHHTERQPCPAQHLWAARGGETNDITATVSLHVSIYNLFSSLLALIGFGNNSD